MSELGVFAVDRGIFDHPLFDEGRPFSRREAWLWLVAEAAWKPRPTRVSGQIIELKRGQLAHSVRFMAAAWGWSKSAVDRFLGRLKTETMIGTDGGTGCGVITICNYDEYQRVGLPNRDSERDANRDSSGTAAGQTRNIQTFNNTPLPPKGASKRAKSGGYGDKANPLFAEFEATIWSKRWPRPNNNPHAAFKAWAKLTDAERDQCRARIERCAAAIIVERSDPKYCPMLSTWINQRGWLAVDDAVSVKPPIDWAKNAAYFRETREWPIGWGPRPGQPGCRCPAELLIGIAAA